ncbi:MAG: hypothetical protein ACT4OP_02915 [Actinomycetota bacterium]
MGAGVAVVRVLVLADEDNELRVAHILAAERSVDSVTYMGTARSATLQRVEDPMGFDVVVGRGRRCLEIAAKIGGAAVTSEQVDLSPAPTVCGASLLGAGLAMAARLESHGTEVERVAIAHPEGPNLGGITIDFPKPVGRASATVLVEDPVELVTAASPNGWSAIVVTASDRQQAVVDDHQFLSAVCLAAGIALVPPAGVVRVWDSPKAYLTRAEEMGLVAAERHP